jgi:AcrR family transcriptional regulator
MPYVSADDRREAFLDAAIDVIAEEGLARTTTRRIAERADAPLGALHYCFRNKNELLELMTERGAATIRAALGELDTSRGVEDVIRDGILVYWRWVKENFGLQLALFELQLWMIRNHREKLASLWNSFGIEEFRAHIDAAAALEGVTLAVPADDVVQFIFHRLDALTLEYAVTSDEQACVRQIDMLTDAMVRAALGPALPQGSRRKATRAG